MRKLILLFLVLASLANAQYFPPLGGSAGGSVTVNGTTCTIGSTCTVTSAPSGAAGGSLSGTYPNPAIANVTTVGAIPYVSASGVLNQDQTVLFWDATNNRLGVGNAAPVATLDVTGRFAVNPGTFFTTVDGGAQFVISGTTASAYIDLNPDAAFFLRGNVAATAGAPSKGSVALRWMGNRWNGSSSDTLQAQAELFPAATIDNSFLAFGFTDNNDRMLNLGHSGNVGIGITIPVYGIDVAKSGVSGTARFFDQTASTGATRVLVSLGAADSASTVTYTNAGTTKSAGYQSSDGSAGVTVTTCTGFKSGLCISGT